MTGVSREVFLDTAALYALIHRGDSLHQRAVAVSMDLEESAIPLVCTDWVLAEFLGRASETRFRAPAARLTDILLSSSNTHIVAASRGGWQQGFSIFTARTDKGWSLVDCISMYVCRSRGISRVFTHDHHFSQAGFQIFLP